MGQVVWEGEYRGRQVRAEIQVEEANALQGMQKTRLEMEAGRFPVGEDGQLPAAGDVDRYLLRSSVYPDLVAGAVEGRIEIDGQVQPWPPTFEAFTELPFPLILAWEHETYRCNPFWLPEAQNTSKKALANGSINSSVSMETARKRKTTASRKQSG